MTRGGPTFHLKLYIGKTRANLQALHNIVHFKSILTDASIKIFLMPVKVFKKLFSKFPKMIFVK